MNIKRPSDRAIGIYLIWVLMHFTILFTTDQCYRASEIFYPFTKGRYGGYGGTYRINFVIDAYDISEFVFYSVSVVILYYGLTLLGLKKPPIAKPKPNT